MVAMLKGQVGSRLASRQWLRSRTRPIAVRHQTCLGTTCRGPPDGLGQQ
jgi:hypothetical protein